LLERFQLLRNIGQYDSVNAGAQIPLSKLTLIYGENGRGKTTLSSVLRSLGTGDAGLVLERHRLGAANPPHVVLGFAGGVTAQFQHGAWSAPMPRIAIFDDAFIAANVCSGVEIGTSHRQNLHELILGAQGVALNAALQVHVARIEDHNRALTLKGNAIPAAARGGLNVDDFCALPADPDIEVSIATAERNLAAARSASRRLLCQSHCPPSTLTPSARFWPAPYQTLKRMRRRRRGPICAASAGVAKDGSVTA